MKYLVDANVLSEPTKPAPDASAVAWLRRHERELAVSPIILGELKYGILILPTGRRRTRLEEWFSAGVPRLQVLDFDTAAAGAWVGLLARLKKKGRAMPIKEPYRRHGSRAQANRRYAEYRRLSHRRSSGREPVPPLAALRMKREGGTKIGTDPNPLRFVQPLRFNAARNRHPAVTIPQRRG